MFRIIKKDRLAENITRLVIEAKAISLKAEAGQFVVVIIDEKGERIPLTLADWDKDEGTITIIFQEVGYSTKKLGGLNQNDRISHVLGPLGRHTEIGRFKEVYCVAGGLGVAEVYPVARAFKKSGSRLISILGSRNKDSLILENEIRGISDEIFISTDDGSYGRKGTVIDSLRDLFAVIEKSTHTEYPDLVYCIGPVMMMKAVADFTRPFNIKTIASLNPIMVDATGMCGSCRCRVGGKTVFGCVDGPDFDAHQVDFLELAQRLNLFLEEEKRLK